MHINFTDICLMPLIYPHGRAYKGRTIRKVIGMRLLQHPRFLPNPLSLQDFLGSSPLHIFFGGMGVLSVYRRNRNLSTSHSLNA